MHDPPRILIVDDNEANRVTDGEEEEALPECIIVGFAGGGVADRQ
jgi:hypothetical protein